MPPAQFHSTQCALNIRARMLYAAGDPLEPDPGLLTKIAGQIALCCGHFPVKAHRLAYGWTVQRAVERFHAMCHSQGYGARGLTERSWKEWEAGGKPNDDYRDLLCRLFRTGPVHLGFARDYTPSSPNHSVGSPSIVGATSESWSDMLRRTFIGGSAALALSGSDVDLDGMVEAIDKPRRTGRIDPARVADLAAISAAYRRSYSDIPASQLLVAAQAHLNLAWSLRPDLQPEGTRKPLLMVIGEMAALVGVLLLFDNGQPDQAWRFVDLAWKAGRAAASSDLQAIVLGGRSFGVAYATGNHRAGLELAEYASEVAATGASAEARGWVAAVASERCASLGDLAGCQRYLSESRAALEVPTNDDRPGVGIGTFTTEKLSAYEGGDLVRLGRYADAEPALDAAISRLDPSMQRHLSTALIDRAEARLGAGEVDAACDDGTAALDLVTQVQHTRNLQRLRVIAQRARDHGALAGRELWRNVLTATAETKGIV